jgi:DNA processing protein
MGAGGDAPPGPGAPEDPAAAAVVALAREVGLDQRDLADRLEQEDPGTLLNEALGAGRSLFPGDPGPRVAHAREELAHWERDGLRLMTVRDPVYPAALRMIHDRPALLWTAGEPALVGNAPAVAVVGTRRPSAEGRNAARVIATDLTHAGITVLSGLAAGIDTVAHQAALDAGGRTVAVIGTGLQRVYPPENAALQAELTRHHAVVSAFWPQDGPAPERFRRRNAIMSGLGLGTIIVEASVRSGTRVQARAALAHGRPVFLRRRLLEQSWAAELARRPGVHVIDEAGDALEVIGRTLHATPLTADRRPRPKRG